MPWKATCPMDERMQFITAWLKGEDTMSGLCRRYGVSRKTGYKWCERYTAEGPAGLQERSHAPHRQARVVAFSAAQAILALRALWLSQDDRWRRHGDTRPAYGKAA